MPFLKRSIHTHGTHITSSVLKNKVAMPNWHELSRIFPRGMAHPSSWVKVMGGRHRTQFDAICLLLVAYVSYHSSVYINSLRVEIMPCNFCGLAPMSPFLEPSPDLTPWENVTGQCLVSFWLVKRAGVKHLGLEFTLIWHVGVLCSVLCACYLTQTWGLGRTVYVLQIRKAEIQKCSVICPRF